MRMHLTSCLGTAEAVVLYGETCAELGWEPDAGRLEAMQSASTAGLAALEEKAKDAQENLGDVEVRDALAAKAEHLCRIGAPAARCGDVSAAQCAPRRARLM